MRTAAGILFIVVSIWIGLEIFTKGTQGAFGGAFSTALAGGPGTGAASHEPPDAPMERIRSAVGNAQREHDARTNRLIGDEPEED